MVKPYNEYELIIATIISFRFLQEQRTIISKAKGASNLFFNEWG